jgi:hypothetical protein
VRFSFPSEDSEEHSGYNRIIQLVLDNESEIHLFVIRFQGMRISDLLWGVFTNGGLTWVHFLFVSFGKWDSAVVADKLREI